MTILCIGAVFIISFSVVQQCSIHTEVLGIKEVQLAEKVGNAKTPEEQEVTLESCKNTLSELVDRLKNGREISSLLSDEIVFVYHADNRVDGSTDGQISYLPSGAIDSLFEINVANDGRGWCGEDVEPSTFEMEFDLQERLTYWSRFMARDSRMDPGVFSIWGGGESDYLVVYIKSIEGRNVIYKLEYRSEDPG